MHLDISSEIFILSCLFMCFGFFYQRMLGARHVAMNIPTQYSCIVIATSYVFIDLVFNRINFVFGTNKECCKTKILI